MDENVKVLSVELPKEADIKLPDPEALRYFREYEQRRVFIDCDIDDWLFTVTKQILEYNRDDAGKSEKDRKPIVMYIMSYGGDLQQTFCLVSTMLASKTPIITVNCGVAMSAGLLLLLAGHKRYAVKYSTAMIHRGSGGAQGTFDEMEEQQKNYRKLIDTMRDYILERTKIDVKTFNRNKSKDWYIQNGEEQVSLGIVDKVVESLDEII
jgi:ATP-dependent Clp protease protease subunit